MERLKVRGLLGLAACLAVAAGAAEPEKKYNEHVRDSLGSKHKFDMVLIPGGTFTMGSPAGEEDRNENEGPQVKVTLKPFYLAVHELNFDLFLTYYDETAQVIKRKRGKKAFERAGPKPKIIKKGGIDGITGPTTLYGDPTKGWGGGDRPAVGMAWRNANTFCLWLSLRTKKTYRLPTEAEWEYACRAGSTTVYNFGDDPDDLDTYAWIDENSDEKTQPVGGKKPNAWGLYDMHGNAMEWVADWYDPKAYAAYKGRATDPRGPKKGEVHVARGGSYESSPEELRSAARVFKKEWWHEEDPQDPRSIWWLPEMTFIGMRVARSVEEEK
jgi:sulfatase modifying factor 1